MTKGSPSQMSDDRLRERLQVPIPKSQRKEEPGVTKMEATKDKIVEIALRDVPHEQIRELFIHVVLNKKPVEEFPNRELLERHDHYIEVFRHEVYHSSIEKIVRVVR